MCFAAGGYYYKEQTFNATAAETNASMLLVREMGRFLWKSLLTHGFVGRWLQWRCACLRLFLSWCAPLREAEGAVACS